MLLVIVDTTIREGRAILPELPLFIICWFFFWGCVPCLTSPHLDSTSTSIPSFYWSFYWIILYIYLIDTAFFPCVRQKTFCSMSKYFSILWYPKHCCDINIIFMSVITSCELPWMQPLCQTTPYSLLFKPDVVYVYESLHGCHIHWYDIIS